MALDKICVPTCCPGTKQKKQNILFSMVPTGTFVAKAVEDGTFGFILQKIEE